MEIGSFSTPRLLLACLVAFVVGGCVDGLPDAQVGRGDVRSAIAKGTLASPRAATVAMASLDGAPQDVAARFHQVFASEAANREIAISDTKLAHYLVRGYLSAYPTDKGAEVSYVYDIFDAAGGRRVDRIADVMTVPGSGADAWAMVDDRVMASLAGRSADDLAVALAGMPEAQAARGTVMATTAAAAPKS